MRLLQKHEFLIGNHCEFSLQLYILYIYKIPTNFSIYEVAAVVDGVMDSHGSGDKVIFLAHRETTMKSSLAEGGTQGAKPIHCPR